MLLVTIERNKSASRVGAHEWSEGIVDGHTGTPGDADGGRVLLGSDHSAVDVLSVSVHHGVHTIVGLIRSQEVHTDVAARLSGVKDVEGKRGTSAVREGQSYSKNVALLVVKVNLNIVRNGVVDEGDDACVHSGGQGGASGKELDILDVVTESVKANVHCV